MKYEYGVEYPTNGKKPDLPDDIRVERKFEGGWSNCNFRCYEYENWSNTVAFRIRDQRYKPIEVEYEPIVVSCAGGQGGSGGSGCTIDGVAGQAQSDWYDYDKQQAIAFPPVGEWVEYDEYQNNQWLKVQVRGYWTENNNTSVWIQSVGKPNVTKNKFRPLDWNRKADEEKRKFVDKCYESAGGGGHDLEAYLMDLYDAGCRFTENKAAS